MKLTAKIVSVLVLEVIILLGIDAWLSVRFALRQFDEKTKLDAYQLGVAIKRPFEEKWRDRGPEEALDLIRQVNDDIHRPGEDGQRVDDDENTLRIRWVWLDAEANGEFRPEVPAAKLERARRGRPDFLKFTDGADAGQAYSYVPVSVDPDRPGALELREPLYLHENYTRRTIQKAGILTLELIVVSGVLGLLMGTWLIGRPLNRLIEKTRRIGGGDLSGPLVIRSRDELAELAVALNDMCDNLAVARRKARSETEARIATLEQMRHMDRLRTVGRLAAGLAHEMGTPLNVISGRADLIAAGRLPPDGVRESVRIIKEQSERMVDIIRHLLDFARHRAPKKSLGNLVETVRRTLDMLAPLAKKANASLLLSGGEAPVMVEIDSYQFEQVLVNVVVNGLQAMPAGGTLEVTVRPDAPRPRGCDDPHARFVSVEVKDEGKGIAPENMANLFDPFFTTKEVGEGTGLGLSIAYGIIREHDGYIDVASEPGKGSCFSIYLPKEV